MLFYRVELIVVEQKQWHRVRTDTAVLSLGHFLVSSFIFSEEQNFSLAILLSSSLHAIT